MSLRQTILVASLLALVAAPARDASATEPKAKAIEDKPQPSLFAPPLARGMTRVQGTARPFFNMIGPGAGVLADFSVEHYFRLPYKLGVEVSPLALVGVPEGLGAIGHARVRGAFASDDVEIGIGVGPRLQRFGPSGLSVAPALRIGALDGLNLRVEVSHSLIRNYYTGKAQFALANAAVGLDVPVSRKSALTLDAGYGLDLWVYTNLGLRQRITGDGGPGTLVIGASFGLVWVVDRFPCQYGDIDPCRGSAWGLGPTIALRIDKRF